MWQAFNFAFNAVMPMLFLMGVGYYLKQRDIFNKETIKGLNFFAFKIAITAMAFHNVYKLKNLGAIPLRFVGFDLVMLFCLTLFGAVVAQFMLKDNKQRGVLVQCAFRSNYNVIGISLADEIGGATAVLVSATALAPTVMYFNVVAVIILTIYGQGGLRGISIKGLISSVLHNSIIIGLTAGLIALVIRELLPLGADGTPIFLLARDMPWFYGAVRELARITPPFLLILLGATVSFSKTGDIKKLLAFCVAMRLVLAPIVGFILFFGAVHWGVITLDKANVATTVGILATPCPVIAAAMAAETGCDGELAGQAVVWTTVLSIFSMMLVIMPLRMYGLL